MCYTKVRTRGPGIHGLLITKGCVAADFCSEMNTLTCDRKQRSCGYCCSMDGCNALGFSMNIHGSPSASRPLSPQIEKIVIPRPAVTRSNRRRDQRRRNREIPRDALIGLIRTEQLAKRTQLRVDLRTRKDQRRQDEEAKQIADAVQAQLDRQERLQTQREQIEAREKRIQSRAVKILTDIIERLESVQERNEDRLAVIIDRGNNGRGPLIIKTSMKRREERINSLKKQLQAVIEANEANEENWIHLPHLIILIS